MKRILSVLLVVFSTCTYADLPVLETAFTPELTAEELSERLDTIIPDKLKSAGVPGISIAIVSNNDIVLNRAWGRDTAFSNQDLTPEFIFEVASLSKPVLAYGVLRLVEQGKVDLSLPVSHYIENGPDITLEQALSHQSGYQMTSATEYAQAPSQQAGFAYTGAGYLIAADVIEAVTKMPVEAYLQAYVLEPLGMNTSGYGNFPQDKQRLATPHVASNFPILIVFIVASTLIIFLTLVLWVYRSIKRRREPLYTLSNRSLLSSLVVAFFLAIASLSVFGVNRVTYITVALVAIIPLLVLAVVLFSPKPSKAKRIGASLAMIAVVFMSISYRMPVPIEYRTATPAAYGGLRATSFDMALFLREVMSPTFLSDQYVELMHQPQVTVNRFNDWSIGLGIQTNSKQKVLWHWGVNYPGYASLMLAYPDHDFGIVILMNGGALAFHQQGISNVALETAREIVFELVGGEHRSYWLGIQ